VAFAPQAFAKPSSLPELLALNASKFWLGKLGDPLGYAKKSCIETLALFRDDNMLTLISRLPFTVGGELSSLTFAPENYLGGERGGFCLFTLGLCPVD